LLEVDLLFEFGAFVAHDEKLFLAFIFFFNFLPDSFLSAHTFAAGLNLQL
jgi:hypothetical protein